MHQLNKLSSEFSEIENSSQGENIVEQIDELFVETMLWDVPECAEELRINLALVLENMSAALKAFLDGNMEEFDRNYGTAQIALDMINEEYELLMDK